MAKGSVGLLKKYPNEKKSSLWMLLGAPGHLFG
jgi:hypothetical protein